LNKNKDFKNIPCHGVIRSYGNIGGYSKGEKKKKELLKAELRRKRRNLFHCKSRVKMKEAKPLSL
jgi:alkylated DNA nucleotide flippase Atl1